MENEMIMTNVEENNTPVELNEESTAGTAAVVAVAMIAVGAVGAAGYGVYKAACKIKNAIANRKAKKIKEAEFVDISEDQTESEEESD